MSDSTTHESAEAKEPAAGSAEGHAEANKEPAKVEHSPGAGSTDYTKHFETLFTSIAALPESLINALREAVPKKEADPQENQHNVVHQEKTEEKIPASGGKSASKDPAKRTFRSWWLTK